MIKLSDILIKNGFIITMDQNLRIIRDGAIYVNEGEIVSVGKTEEVTSSSAEFVIDAKNKVILPGFVNDSQVSFLCGLIVRQDSVNLTLFQILTFLVLYAKRK